MDEDERKLMIERAMRMSLQSPFELEQHSPRTDKECQSKEEEDFRSLQLVEIRH